ncbi:hypothetical protein CQA53_07835 [Helicobacter didelphidarum]|uniref:Cell division topological specificity factor n=1 Tax=Helicobacter didelphidarum TaxID=2040648 RepID=A0A3D8IG55_9HELI|nr:cell division topological specificity factor MinE [Helicobacter didelphidarum]RDU64227.1 hypothetical protein CQA53_07835 [Helicobacter didelphidarum]
MMFFWSTNNKNGSANIAKKRLQIMLNEERGMGITYLEDLKQEIAILVHKYAHTSCDISTQTNRNNNSVDIKVSINMNTH